MIRAERMLHVGEMDPSLKRPDSYEGAGLSVSLHPSAWRTIARGRVGGPCWELRRAGGALLDAHRVRGCLAREILAWGSARGYVVEAPLWRLSHWDDDIDQRVSQTFATLREAKDESWDGELGRPRRITGHASTPVLDALCMQGRPSLGDRNVLDLLIPLWAREAHGLDGVWWNDRLDPSALSAPRGVLTADVVGLWSAERLATDPDDDDREDGDGDGDGDDDDDE